MLKLLVALAIADASVFFINLAALLLVNSNVSKASNADFPLTKSATSLAFLGDNLTNLDVYKRQP